MRLEPLQPGHVVSNRYRVEGLLGEGGMGSVYRAIQVSVDRPVALKVISESLCKYPPAVERFQREGRLLARLKHPNTVCLFDFGATEQGQPYIVMELLEGGDLASRLRNQGPIPWSRACQLCWQVLRSLEEAHRLGIVHRDIKPANLFLCTAGSQAPFVKVLDFGISGLASTEADMAHITAAGTIIGSAPYMSPEQAQGKRVTAATDIYSVGVVLFEMLTGRTLFEGDTRTALLLAKLSQRPPSVRQFRPDLQLPDELHALLDQLLVPEPERRPSSAGAVAERLEDLLRSAGEWHGPRSVTPGFDPGSVGQRRGVAQTEPMSFGAGHTAVLPGVTSIAKKRRYQMLAVMAIAPVALLGAVGLRGVFQVPDLVPVQPEPEPARQQTTQSLQQGPPATEPSTPSRRVAEPQPPPKAPTKPGLSTAAPVKTTPTLNEESVAEGVEREQMATRMRLAVQYKTIAEAIAARDAGKISTQQMNRLVRPLQQAEDQELARVGRVYKDGDLAASDYEQARREIKRKYSGAP
ncbi:MAG: hypothetical protein RL685_855 [Pseudomonadota bacterium]|jgi:serine/threonine-protein kinase